MTPSVDLVAVMKRASVRIPNEDYVEFYDAMEAAATLVEATQRTVRALEALGEASGMPETAECRRECEAAMVAQKAALAAVQGGQS